ncbi:hepatocyte cell adhesion molecule-like [Protopterus annectens]|uniref:hepatocyte cell adhesion molecule-like n=1 Tax=Protopterus annectens TaxID=7888 RepID=UPI001CF94DF6|nr:hepatocyte cell adhesion molecule-like [Protopterus annectens]
MSIWSILIFLLVVFEVCVITEPCKIPGRFARAVGESIIFNISDVFEGNNSLMLEWKLNETQNIVISANNVTITHPTFQHRVSFSQTFLHLNLLKLTDEGTHSVFIGGTKKKCFQLTVDVPVSKPRINVSIETNQTRLECIVDTGTRVVYEWLLNDSSLPSQSWYSLSDKNTTLTLNITSRDSFKCTVKNSVSSNTSDLVLPGNYRQRNYQIYYEKITLLAACISALIFLIFGFVWVLIRKRKKGRKQITPYSEGGRDTTIRPCDLNIEVKDDTIYSVITKPQLSVD